MTQRTFNEINTSVRSPFMNELSREDMETEPVQKNKRGRKRQNDEECLSESERIKKEKNRKAAQKCREKKEKEAKDLKIRNEELERENKKLSDEKKKLVERTQEFHKIITAHIKKGCKLPPNLEELYNEETQVISLYESSEENEIFRAVGTIERDQTPPHTPEDTSSGSLSPHRQFYTNTFTEHPAGAPTALFSGTPLSRPKTIRMSSSSISRSSSSSSSPAPSLSPARTLHPTREQLKENSHFMASVRFEIERDHTGQLACHSGQILPTVVSELDEELENSSEYISKSFEEIDRERMTCINIHPNKVIERNLQSPEVMSGSEVARILSSEIHNTSSEESSHNLSSLGFNCVADYSYTKDLQQMESVQEIIEYTNCGNQNDSQSLNTEKQSSSDTSPGRSESQPVVNVNVCALALLDMGTEMSESLQQQIKTSYSYPSSSVPATISDSRMSQQNVMMHQVSAQNLQINPKSNLGQQQNLLKEQPLIVFKKYLEVLKQRQIQHGSQTLQMMHSLDSIEHPQTILKSDQAHKIHPVVQNQCSEQSQDASQPSLKQATHQLLTQISGQILPQGSQSIRTSQQAQKSVADQSSKELPFQQFRQQQMILRPTAKDHSIPVAIVQAMGYPSSSTGMPHQSLSYSNSTEAFDSSGSHLILQHARAAKLSGGNGYILPNIQASEAYPQLLSTSDSSANENIDYSANVQDLPSLNFTELQSENNLFEKKPSRLNS